MTLFHESNLPDDVRRQLEADKNGIALGIADDLIVIRFNRMTNRWAMTCGQTEEVIGALRVLIDRVKRKEAPNEQAPTVVDPSA